MTLSDEELDRYARHIVLREVGGPGQAKLRAARVLVVGAGGLGSPVILYLAAAGVGTHRHRRFRHRLPVQSPAPDRPSQRRYRPAQDGIGRRRGPGHQPRHPASRRTTCGFHRDNALDLIAGYDLVADGSDNFDTRFLVNDAAFLAQRTLVSAAVTEFDGQLATFKAHDSLRGLSLLPLPLSREPPPPGTAPSCSETGVLGAAAGVMGTLQALEVLKEILGHRRQHGRAAADL